jgi:XTP/dITP diphosphohydrolase
MELLLATTSPGKIAEIEPALKDLRVKMISLRSLASCPEIIEDGASFEDNALKKARTLASFSGLVTLADDSGLEVDALHGAPGIYSARYSGPGADDTRNNEKLLRELTRVPPERRGARYVCVLALCSPVRGREGEWVFRGECWGWISISPKGGNGFGYDPLFIYSPLNKTFGELDRKTKGAVSHRGQALQKLLKEWNFLFPPEVHS